MPTMRSAGLLLFQISPTGELRVLLAHMGGPFWERKNDGAWSIPKGEYHSDDDPLEAARREFQEETGSSCPSGRLIPLGDLRQPGGKVITAWAVEADFDAGSIVSNTFSIEWPRHSGVWREFPEIDRGAWFDLLSAERKMVKGQVPFLERLRSAVEAIGDPRTPAPEAADLRSTDRFPEGRSARHP